MKAMYFMALITPEPLLSEISAVKHELSRKYKTYSSLRSPAHITLVPPFHYRQEDEYLLIRNMLQFHSSAPQFDITLDGFGCFAPRVIFVRPLPSAELTDLYDDLQTHVRTFLPERKKTSPPFHPHITVANRDWSEYDFYKAWDEMRTRPFSGAFTAEKISLLKLEKEKWKVLAKFSLKPQS